MITKKYSTMNTLDVFDNNIKFQNNENELRRLRNNFSNVHIVKGDVSTFSGDAVVNAANKYLAPGAGVCGAIFEKAGYRELQNECMKIGGCDVGNAVITKGFNLKSDYIIHAVGPHYLRDKSPEKLLENVYENVFRVALENKIK